jgi:hypothetical protein
MKERKTVHTGCLLATITSDGDMEDVIIEWDKDVPANIACAILDTLRDGMNSAAWIANHVTSAEVAYEKSDGVTNDSDRAGLLEATEKPKGSKAH